MTATAPDIWSEVALISIASSGGSEVQFAGRLSDINFKRGNKPIDTIAVLNGGRLVAKKPEEPTEVTLTAYPVDVNSVGGGGMAQFYNGTFDSTQPLSSTNSRLRNLYRVTLLCTDDATCTTATGAIVSGSYADRVSMKNAYITGMEGPVFEDNLWKETYTFTIPPFNASGTGNYTYESTDGTAAITALSAYTT